MMPPISWTKNDKVIDIRETIMVLKWNKSQKGNQKAVIDTVQSCSQAH